MDTSIWIDFLKGSSTEKVQHLERLIEESEPLAILPIILMEILQGVPDKKQFFETREKLSVLHWVSIEDDDYLSAVDIYRQCAQKGSAIRKGVDAIIAAACIRNHLELFHKDRDFEKIAKTTRLKIHSF